MPSSCIPHCNELPTGSPVGVGDRLSPVQVDITTGGQQLVQPPNEPDLLGLLPGAECSLLPQPSTGHDLAECSLLPQPSTGHDLEQAGTRGVICSGSPWFSPREVWGHSFSSVRTEAARQSVKETPRGKWCGFSDPPRSG